MNKNQKELLKSLNEEVAAKRIQEYEDSMGLKAVLYQNITPKVELYDMMKGQEEVIDIGTGAAIFVDGNLVVCSTLPELLAAAKASIDVNDLNTLIADEVLCGYEVLLSEHFKEKLYEYRTKW